MPILRGRGKTGADACHKFQLVARALPGFRMWRNNLPEPRRTGGCWRLESPGKGVAALEPGQKRQDRYLRLPVSFLNSPDFVGLSGSATKLIMAVAEQYRGSNNGRLLPGLERVNAWGWNPSPNTLAAARKELRGTRLVVVTRVGRLPNRTEWWALTCWDLDWVKGMDIDPKGFQRGAYLDLRSATIDPAGRPKHAMLKNASSSTDSVLRSGI